MIVVDTNVLCYFWLPGPLSADAERLFETDPNWCAPVLWRSEFRNVLARYIRRGLTDLSIGLQIMSSAELQMQEREFTVPSLDVLERAAQSGCSAYDCEFVVLAEDLELPLITTDRQLLRAFPKVAHQLGAKFAR